jgi:hypothetical protein
MGKFVILPGRWFLVTLEEASVLMVNSHLLCTQYMFGIVFQKANVSMLSCVYVIIYIYIYINNDVLLSHFTPVEFINSTFSVFILYFYFVRSQAVSRVLLYSLT